MTRRILLIGGMVSILLLAMINFVYAQDSGPQSVDATALGTAFTYQGYLKNNGSPINDSCDFQLYLYDSLAGTGQIGSTVSRPGIQVANGYFMITNVDFGSTAFNGDARWLRIDVRCPGGSGSYTTLTPRQPLTPAPYALALPGLYTQQSATSPNLIGGYSGNVISSTVHGSVIGGGGDDMEPNRIQGYFAVIGGGAGNLVRGSSATISGGYYNEAAGSGAAIGGGRQNDALQSYNTIAGGHSNATNALTATIGGGEHISVTGKAATVAGGSWITVTGNNATVGGGKLNMASGGDAVIGGGVGNLASGNYATVSGGRFNDATDLDATVCGGASNSATGSAATVIGGAKNKAVGDTSLAAGYRAQANHTGTFVWADSYNDSLLGVPFASTKIDQFLVRAGGGVGINTADTLANGLTVDGRVIAGGTATGVPGGEPFVARGSSAGISLEDRSNAAQRWVTYANDGSLRFWNGTDRLLVGNTGVVTLTALGSAGSTTLCRNAANQIATCSSSIRYKNNVDPLDLGLETVAQLQPVTFDWNDSGEHDLGFVAEDVDKITPLLTTRNAEGQVEGVKYDRISAVLVKAVQEQQQQIAALQQQNAELQAQLAGLDTTAAPTSFNVFNLLSVLALATVGAMIWQQRAKRGER